MSFVKYVWSLALAVGIIVPVAFLLIDGDYTSLGIWGKIMVFWFAFSTVTVCRAAVGK